MALVRNTTDHAFALTVGYIGPGEERNIDVSPAWEQALLADGDLEIVSATTPPLPPPFYDQVEVKRGTGELYGVQRPTGARTQLPVESTVEVLARQTLAASGRPSDALALHPDATALAAATVLSAAGGASTIASAVRIAPKRATASMIDIENDPHFEYVAQRPGKLAVSFTDMTYPDLLTGGSSQAARDRPRPRTVHNGQKIGWYLRTRGTLLPYRILVDGLPLTAGYVVPAVTASSRYHLELDFGSVATRLVEIEVIDIEFGGVYIEPTATVARPRTPRPKLVGFGDSITGGASAVGAYSGDTWLRHAANLLGCDWVNVSIGGTGYLTTAGGRFRDRIADVVAHNPEVVVLFGGYNDVASKTATEIGDEASYVIGQLRAQLPDSLIVVVGIWQVSSSAWAAGVAADQAIRAAAAAQGVSFISLMDPTYEIPTTPPWAPSTAYAVGDQRLANGYVQKCIVAHTSGASFSQTNWRPTTFITGTGKVGATNGTGNADVLIGSDGVHPPPRGGQVLGFKLAQDITRALVALL